jgi:STE24 endopeptidase
MHTFTYVFLVVTISALLLQQYLVWRQMNHVRRHRAAVPPAFAEKIPLSAHQKAADYTLAKNRLERIDIVYSTILLLLWTLGGGLALLDDAIRTLGLSSLWTGTVFLLALSLIASWLDLPLAAWRTFVLEQRFGFNRTTIKIFIGDQLKQVLLLLLLGTPLLLVILWLMANSGSAWWVYVWAVWIGFGLFMMWAYPTFIAPLFNKFSPLKDENLRQRIARLLERCGFTSKGIFVVDGSKRSGHGNAYFTGLGHNKRIVFFDTLLDSLGAEEIEAVLAHELGHFKRKHIIKRIISMAVFALLGLALLGWLIEQPWFYTALGVKQASLYMALALFMLIMPVFTIFLQPLASWFSRKHEFEADAFAAQQSDANALVQALVKLYEENASTLTPDPLYSAFHDSHPPAPVRIDHLYHAMAQQH